MRRKQRTTQVENGPTLFPTHNKALKRQSFHAQIYRIHSFRRTSDIADAGKADSDSGVLTAPPKRQTFKETQISRKAQFVNRLTASARLAGRMRSSEEARSGRAPPAPLWAGPSLRRATIGLPAPARANQRGARPAGTTPCERGMLDPAAPNR